MKVKAEVKKKLILHAVDASQNGATEWTFFTGHRLFVLCLRIYPEFLRKNFSVTGIGNRRRKFQLRPIYLALGDLGTQFLPSLHSFSGADITETVA